MGCSQWLSVVRCGRKRHHCCHPSSAFKPAKFANANLRATTPHLPTCCPPASRNALPPAMHSQALNACFRNIFAPRRVNRELRGQSCGGEGGALRPARGCSGGSRPLERSCSGHIFPPCCASSNHAPHTQRSSPSCPLLPRRSVGVPVRPADGALHSGGPGLHRAAPAHAEKDLWVGGG